MSLAMLRDRMAGCIENGVRRGWLIDPLLRRTHVNRPGQAVEILDGPEPICGDPVLPAFSLDLLETW